MARAIKKIKLFIEMVTSQASGKTEDLEELIPEYGICGTGYLFCLEYNTRNFTRVSRGQKVYVVDDKRDDLNRVLIFTNCGKLVEIDVEELIYTEFD